MSGIGAEQAKTDPEFREAGGAGQVIQVEADGVAEVARLTGHNNPELIEEWSQRVRDGRQIMFAVKVDEAIAGSINLMLDGPDEKPVREEIGADVPMVIALDIAAAYRRKGLGSMLMDRCEAYVLQRDDLPNQVVLGVVPANEPARKMYEARSYRYQTVDGKDTYQTSWPDVDEEGNNITHHAEQLLMVKELNRDE